MLTRIRIQAQGSTVPAVQEDLFAAYDAICSLVYATGNGTIPPCKLTGEHYEQVDPPREVAAYHDRWYEGRAMVEFPDDAGRGIGAHDLRGRTEWLDKCDQQSWAEACAEHNVPLPGSELPPDARVDYGDPAYGMVAADMRGGPGIDVEAVAHRVLDERLSHSMAEGLALKPRPK